MGHKAKGKSSATSGTRKKHARRLAATDGDEHGTPPPPAPGGHKLDKKERKDKRKGKVKGVYVPPPKPPQPPPDPLDSRGIASMLPPELTVLLRKLGKKDVVTRQRALEELLAWIKDPRGDGEEEEREAALMLMLPVWAHHYPRLSAHSSRRLRYLSALIHDHLLRNRSIRSELLGSPEVVEAILGSWAVSVYDVDRMTAEVAKKGWRTSVEWSEPARETQVNEGLEDIVEEVHERLSSSQGPLASETISPAPSTPGTPLRMPTAPSTSAHSSESKLLLTSDYLSLLLDHFSYLILSPSVALEAGGEAKSRDAGTMEEDAVARRGRLAGAAIGALDWVVGTHPTPLPVERLLTLVSSPILWTAVSSHPGALGESAPHARSRAYALLRTVVEKLPPDVVQRDMLRTVSKAALNTAAWEEMDIGVRRTAWDGVLVLLRKFPQAWEIASGGQRVGPGRDGEEESDESDEEDESGSEEDSSPRSAAYASFLSFLQTACASSPVLSYPVVLLILSTIPPSVLPLDPPSLSELFASFYAALDSRALENDPLGAKAWLAAFLECAVWMAKKTSKEGGPTGPETAKAVLSEQIGRVLRELVEGRQEVSGGKTALKGRRIGNEKLALEVAATLRKLDGSELLSVAWEPFRTALLTLAVPAGEDDSRSPVERLAALHRIFDVLVALRSPAGNGGAPSDHILGQIGTLVRDAVLLTASSFPQAGEVSLELMCRALLDFDACLAEGPDGQKARLHLDEVAIERLPAATSSSLSSSAIASFLLAFLSRRGDSRPIDLAWTSVLGAIASLQDGERRVELLVAILATENAALPEGLANAQLDDLALDLLDAKLESDALDEQTTELLSRFLIDPMHLIGPSTVGDLFARLAKHIRRCIDSLVTTQAAPNSLVGPLRLVRRIASKGEDLFSKTEEASSLIPSVFEMVHVVSKVKELGLKKSETATAKEAWNVIVRGQWDTEKLVRSVCERLRERVSSVVVRVSPEDLVAAAFSAIRSLGFGQWTDLVLEAMRPSPSALTNGLAMLVEAPPNSALALLDPVVVQTGADSLLGERRDDYYDFRGFSAYARQVSALVALLLEDRVLARRHPWTLRHVLAVSIAAEDERALRGSAPSVFSSKAGPGALEGVRSSSVRLSAHIVSSMAGDLPSDWHVEMVASLRSAKDASADDEKHLSDVLRIIFVEAKTSKRSQDARLFNRILTAVLHYSAAGPADAERWLALAQSEQDSAPELAEAIIHAIQPLVYESPRFDRLRNELASRLSGVPSAKASTDGLRLLRLLLASAPPLDSTVIFLPQQRSIFLLQALQRWVASDDEFVDEINSRLAELGVHLAPIIQDLSGSHWDFLFDLIETNLEISSVDDLSTLDGLWHTLRLVDSVKMLAESNETIQGYWRDRRQGILELVRNLFLAQDGTTQSSEPQRMCGQLIVELVRDMPASSLGFDEHFAPLCALLTGPENEIQTVSYRLLSTLVKKRTEDLVVEAAMEPSKPVAPAETAEAGEAVESPMPALVIELPAALVAVLDSSLEVDMERVEEEEDFRLTVFGRLLAWLLALDHFEQASLKLKASYIEQLERLGLVWSSLLPLVFTLLGVTEHPKPFDPSRWAIDEVYVDELASDDVRSLQVLAGHVYYRSLAHVPSLIRSWWSDCKNRQLSMAVTSFTTKHCSPLISDRELSHLREPEALSELQNESMSIKVLTGTNEVTASYTVDEQPMEISVKLPSDFPLHGVEVRDLKRVGVSEAQWRSWLLGVQQVITSRNGLILDALMLFKKNAEAKFEGLSECAICYAVIGMMDRSLPTKPCKTCKNRFHPGCLLKWFSTSSSATCPLCRSSF